MSIIPTTPLTVAAATPTLPSSSSPELGMGSILASSTSGGGASTAASGLPNPYAEIFPGSISTNTNYPKNPYTYTNTSSHNTTSSSNTGSTNQAPSSATIGILCVAIVFLSVLAIVGVWFWRERRDDAKRLNSRSIPSTSDEDVEKGNGNDHNGRSSRNGRGNSGEVTSREECEDRKSGMNSMAMGVGVEENFMKEGFLGQWVCVGVVGVGVGGNETSVNGVVGERVLRIF